MPKLGKLTLLSILSLTSSLSAYGKSNEPTTCEPTSYPERVTIRAMEGKGVGYNTGYTTLEGFFAFPNLMDTAWVPFFDFRGHVFNDGKTAANAGFGVRYVGASQVWGINSYYDFRHTSHRNFNQYGIGLECLGRVFDFRINGYFPFGKKESSLYGTKFDYFKGHHLILSQKKEYAFTGANAEVGVHAKVTDDINFYTAAGPYFIDHGSRNAWGGELRVAFDFTKYFRVEGNTSYDRIFKWVGQGQVSLNLPFGPRDKISRKGSNSCDKQLMLRDRSLQRVDRDEIIVIEKRKSHTTAIDPATELPFFFVFVNNTSHSSGTFESPYPTLTQAQANSAPGNYILVSSGNGSAYTNQPITLQNNQTLWGTGLSYLLNTKQGAVIIPALSSTPTLSISTASTNAVTLGNNCEVAGLNFSQNTASFALFGGDPMGLIPGITNAYIHNNTFTGGAGSGAIELVNCVGNLKVASNQVTNMTNSINIVNATVPIISDVRVVNNSISSSGRLELNFQSPAGNATLYIANNTASNSFFEGLFIFCFQGQAVCGTVENNTFINSTGTGFFLQKDSTGLAQLNIQRNVFSGNTPNGFAVINQLGVTCLSLERNTATNNTNSGYSFANIGTLLQVENFSNFSSSNVGSVGGAAAVTSVPIGACSCD